MLFRAAFLSLAALLFANQAIGAAISPEIATSPCLFPSNQPQEDVLSNLWGTDYACNCPNNCSHKQGSSCKYYSGPSDSSPVISGSKLMARGLHICGMMVC